MPRGQCHVMINSWTFLLVLPGTNNLITLSKEVLVCIMAKITI